MSLLKTYSGVKVVEDFNKINDLYSHGSLNIHDTNIEEGLIKNEKLYPNQCLVLKDGTSSALGIIKKDKIKLVDSKQCIGKIKPRNKEQALLVELLKDPDIDLLTISGAAGSGKTLFSTAFAWEQFSKCNIDSLILIKSLTPVGEEIGFLKGSMTDKVLPFLGNYLDQLNVLGVPDYVVLDYLDPEKRASSKDVRRIEITPIAYIQGRSIRNAIILVDEAENIPSQVISQVVTRAGENTKIVLLGDPSQTFKKGLTETKNGLVSTIEAGKTSDIVGHITLLKSERSRLAEWASNNL